MLRLALVIVIAIAVLAGCGGAARVGGEQGSPRVLTLLDPIDDPAEISLFTRNVDRLSHGALRVRIVPPPSVDEVHYEDVVIRDVERGRADLGWTGSRAWGGSLRALAAPMLIDSYPLEERVLRDDVVEHMLGELRPHGLVGLGVLPGPLRKPIGLAGRMVTPADFRGREIGVQQSGVAVAAMRALGASPLDEPIAFDTAGLDGLEAQVPAFYGRGLDAPGTHVSGNVNLWPRPIVLFGNASRLARLTDEQRRILHEAARATFPELAAYQRANDPEATATLCRRGRAIFDTASPADLRALRAAFEPVYRELEADDATRAAIDDITAIKRELGAPPAGVPACPREPAPARARARTPLAGVWRMDTGRAASAPDFQDENWGHWIFVFDRGRFADTQENPHACTWGYGTFTVSGRRTTWRFLDGGGDAPNNAQNKPGEEFAFGLSVFRDTLTLTPVKGAISPGNFRVKAWRRVSSTPSRAYFSDRCPPPPAALG
jgi:TRAP-type C4-dicarboxylate transport system substrate-binding protein